MTPLRIAGALLVVSLVAPAAAEAVTPVPSGAMINGPGIPPALIVTPTPTPATSLAITPTPSGPVAVPEQPIRLPRTGEPSGLLWQVIGGAWGITVGLIGCWVYTLRRRSGR